MFRRSKDEETNSMKIEKLYDKYKSSMLREANRILRDRGLAEDAVHQSFIKLMKNIEKVDDNDESKTKNFLIIICRNTQ